jgi:hypothetical protein
MMGASVAVVMAPLRQWFQPLASSCVLLAGILLPGESLGAPFVPFPSQQSLREVQLAALGCARENTAESCSKARQLGDPLMDHPRLPANCKDLIWQMLNKAQPAAANSFSRREAIEDPAERLLLVCRSADKPEAATPPAAQPAGGGGINFGGGQR